VLRRFLAWVLAVGCSTALLACPDAVAAGPEPSCRWNPQIGRCEVSVTDPGKPASDDPGKPEKSKEVSTSGCRFEGKVIPCKSEYGFWDPSTNCYLTPIDKPRTLFGTSQIPPGSKFYECWVLQDVIDGKLSGIEKFESVIREPGEVQTRDPREVAREVVDDMNFVAPQLGLSPYVQSARREGVVHSPVWMWVTDPGESTTGPLSARATLDGVTIEAVGTIDRIEWSMGDGQKVTCKGAGTPFDRTAMQGKSLKEVPVSPTCGHRYVKTSRCEKGGTFPVTATAYWNVHWTGGGIEGDIPLQFTRSTTLSVIDLRPVLVAPDSGDPQVTSPPRSCS
jgi:hypothetical protein